ncbi:MAG: hypothetical protein DRJ01_15585 [Bacteroidetes bacterium]|nr:MAG: hypothetical protein DRJ01_15585 [Bacteroidota bacterium]
MNYKDKLIELYKEAKSKKSYASDLSKTTQNNIQIIAEKCFTQKGVYTVLVTLSIYKILHQNQDIRNHQTQIPNGFSGRTIDTQFITPTLKELKLPSMAESGWLTRSLEQPYPYTLDYNGKISNKKVKKAFLELINDIETENVNPKHIIVELLKTVIQIQEENKIIIKPLENPEKLTITKIINILDEQFSYHYEDFGGSKLPVLAFYAIYQMIINEISRYDGCELKELGSHTASDRTSKSAGDIEVFKEDLLFEAIEIKLDKEIDANILRIAEEKVIRYNPQRYYILSYFSIKEQELKQIQEVIDRVKKDHGCQIVINGILPTIKYYLRLLSDLESFINSYSILIQDDLELKSCHKEKWKNLIMELQSDL